VHDAAHALAIGGHFSRSADVTAAASNGGQGIAMHAILWFATCATLIASGAIGQTSFAHPHAAARTQSESLVHARFGSIAIAASGAGDPDLQPIRKNASTAVRTSSSYPRNRPLGPASERS
jgi:hypothetical protein